MMKKETVCFHVMYHVILTAITQDKYFYHPHFIDEKTKT